MRKQRAFASLTEEEIDQIAEWLRHDNYDHVRERIARPRPEGFGLTMSNKPLQILFARKNTVDKINRKLETGQKLTLAEFESIATGEKADLPEQIHNAILETTYDCVLEGDNTPTQLLALQRLADFPARTHYREHKIQMDLHRKEMAEHRKHISEERLELSRRLAKVREEELALKKSASGTVTPDHPRIPVTPELIRARAIAKYGFDAEELARKAQERAKAVASATTDASPESSGPRSVPDRSASADTCVHFLAPNSATDPSHEPHSSHNSYPCPSAPSVVNEFHAPPLTNTDIHAGADISTLSPVSVQPPRSINEVPYDPCYQPPPRTLAIIY